MIANAQRLGGTACKACGIRTPILHSLNRQQTRPFRATQRMGVIYSRVILPLTTASATTTSSQSRADPRAKHFWTKDEVPPLDGKVELLSNSDEHVTLTSIIIRQGQCKIKSLVQVFLVTGSSSGMGWYCAKTLAENGGHVIMAARSLERTQKAAQMIKVHCMRNALGACSFVLIIVTFNKTAHYAGASGRLCCR